MNIVMNGKFVTVSDGAALSSLIQEKCPNPQCVISEVNEQIVKRENWENHTLNEGDQIELVTFVGGG